MSLVSRLTGVGASGFGYGSSAEDVTAGLDLSTKCYLITGCNSGIGMETARVLALRGATVVGAARTVDKARAAGAELGINLTPVACELSDTASVRACIDAVKAGPRLDGIICNAGIMALPTLQVADGLELQFRTNHIGHFMLTTGLIDHLTPDGRVVVVASEAHKNAYKGGIQFANLDGSKGYSGWGAYGQSKLANILFARALARRLDGERVANALHPGVIHTNLARSMNPIVNLGFAIGAPLVLKSIAEGAATQAWAAAHPDAGTLRGEYLKDCNVSRSSAYGSDDAMAERLWEESERIVAAL